MKFKRHIANLIEEKGSSISQRKFSDLIVGRGLGESGVLHVMPSEFSDSAGLKDLVDTFLPLKNEGVQTVDIAASKKFYSPKGDVIDFVSQLAPKSSCAIALTLEYGTLGSHLVNELDTVSRLILENQAHHYGCASDAVCAEVKRAFVDLFNPNENAWRDAVLSRADGLFDALANGHFR